MCLLSGGDRVCSHRLVPVTPPRTLRVSYVRRAIMAKPRGESLTALSHAPRLPELSTVGSRPPVCLLSGGDVCSLGSFPVTPPAGPSGYHAFAAP